jgi:hypothetical protein
MSRLQSRIGWAMEQEIEEAVDGLNEILSGK